MVRSPGTRQEAVHGLESVFGVTEGTLFTPLSLCFHICKFGTVLASGGLDCAEG